MKDVYICNKCGSKDVQSKMWVNINDDHIDKNSVHDLCGEFTEPNDNWCVNCSEHVVLIPKINYINHD